MSRESMKIVLLSGALVAAMSPALQSPATAATPPYKVLFDNPSAETSWTGAISAWGVALQRTGSYSLATLPSTGKITYGDSTNAQDLSNYDEFVLPEPNILFTAAEKTAIMKFVQAGGGLFMV